MKEQTRDIILMIYQFIVGGLCAIFLILEGLPVTGRILSIAEPIRLNGVSLAMSLSLYVMVFGAFMLFAQRKLYKNDKNI